MQEGLHCGKRATASTTSAWPPVKRGVGGHTDRRSTDRCAAAAGQVHPVSADLRAGALATAPDLAPAVRDPVGDAGGGDADVHDPALLAGLPQCGPAPGAHADELVLLAVWRTRLLWQRSRGQLAARAGARRALPWLTIG